MPVSAKPWTRLPPPVQGGMMSRSRAGHIEWQSQTETLRRPYRNLRADACALPFEIVTQRAIDERVTGL